MRNAYRVLGYLLVAEVVIQTMAIAYGVSDDAVGFDVHRVNGMMIMPLVALLFLVTALFAKVPRGIREAAVVLVLVVVQVVLGIVQEDVPGVSLLHALTAFAVIVVALRAARAAGAAADAPGALR